MFVFKPLLSSTSVILVSLLVVACSNNEPASSSTRSITGSPVYLHMKKGRSFTSVSNSSYTSSKDTEPFRLYPDGKVTPNYSPTNLKHCSRESVDKYGKLCKSYFIAQSVTPGSLVGTAVAAALTSGLTLLGGLSKVPTFNQAAFDQAVNKSSIKTYTPMILAFKAKVGSQPFSFSKETLTSALFHSSGSTNYLLNKMLERNKSGSALKMITNPSDEQIMLVLKNDPSYIKRMTNPRDKFQRFIISNNAKNIKYIKNPAEHIQLMAVEKDINIFASIKSPTSKVMAYALSRKGTLISHIKNPSAQLQRVAVTQNPKAIDEISKPAESVQLYVLKTKGASFLHDYVSESSMANSVLKHPEMVRYLGAYKGAASRRSSYSSSGSSSYGSSSSSSYGSSYSPPTPSCRNEVYTTCAPGMYPCRRVQNTRRVCN